MVIALINVGTRTTPKPAFLQFSIASNLKGSKSLPLLLIYGSGVTPSKARYTVFNPAAFNSLAKFSLLANLIPLVAI